MAKKAAEEEKKEKEKQEELKRIEQQRLKQQMEQMHIGYKPPQQYLDKYQDADFFNYQYNKYLENLANPTDEDTGALPQTVQSHYEDHDDQEEQDVAPKYKS